MNNRKTSNYYQAALNRQTFQRLLAMTPQQLDKVDNSPNATVLEKAAIAAIKRAIRLGRFRSIDTMIRIMHRP